MNMLKQQIENQIEHIAGFCIDTQGVESAGFDPNIPQDMLSLLTELLIADSSDDFVFLTEYKQYTDALSLSLRGEFEARESLADVIDIICIKHYQDQLRRLIDYRINELRKNYFDAKGCITRVDPETGETIWNKK